MRPVAQAMVQVLYVRFARVAVLAGSHLTVYRLGGASDRVDLANRLASMQAWLTGPMPVRQPASEAAMR